MLQSVYWQMLKHTNVLLYRREKYIYYLRMKGDIYEKLLQVMQYEVRKLDQNRNEPYD